MNPLRIQLHRVLWLALLGLFLAARVQAAPVEEKWLKISAEHFTILTPAPEKTGRHWAVQLEQFRRGMQTLFPVAERRLRPVTVVLFPNDRAMLPYKPRENGQPSKVGGLFVRTNDINTIMLSLEADLATTRHVIFHEAVHWHQSAFDGPQPLWFTEGLAEVCATFELRDQASYSFGTAIVPHVFLLRRVGLKSLPWLFGVSRDSLEFNEGSRTSIFYAEAWAFVHFLIYGKNSPGPESIGRYLELLQKGKDPEAAFKAAFGGSYAEVGARLEKYIRDGSYVRRTYTGAVANIERTLRVGPASLAEVELARGSLMFGARTPDDAEPHLRRAAELAPGDPRAWEMLGHVAVARNDLPAAREALARAAAAGSDSYLVFHNLAVSRMPSRGDLALAYGAIDPHEFDEAAADYRRAIALSPGHVPSYAGLAGLIYSMATFQSADLALLRHGLSLSPQDASIQVGLAAADFRTGHSEDGRAKLEQLLAVPDARPTQAVAFAQRLLAAERLKADGETIDRLLRQQKFREVVAVVDGALGRDLDPVNRQSLKNTRRQALEYQRVLDTVELVNSGRIAEAKLALTEMVAPAGDCTRETQSEARRLLREIEKQEGRNRR